MTVSAPGLGSTGRSRNWGRRKTPSSRRIWANFTATLWSRRNAAAIYSSSPHATSMERSFTASAIRHRFSMKFLRDRSGTAALTRITPTTLATTGPAARLVPRRWAIQTESAMAPPGIHRTLPKDAARQRSKAQEGLDFFIALPSIDHLSRDGHSALVSNVARAYRLRALLREHPRGQVLQTATYRWPNFIFSLTVAALAEACSSDRAGIVRKGTACRA